MHSLDRFYIESNVGKSSTSCEHQNPVCICNTGDADRADYLREYVELLEESGHPEPRFMPTSDGKKPLIETEGITLDSEEGRRLLVCANEAIQQFERGNVDGFCLYAGKPSHGTTKLCFVDNDNPDTFPTEAFPDAPTAVSGSGSGSHATYLNDGTVKNAKGKGDVDGEVRAENWYIVVPGSIHPSGGIYHLAHKTEIPELGIGDIPEKLQPSDLNRGKDLELKLNESLGTFNIEDAGVDVAKRLSEARASKKGNKIGSLLDGNYADAGFPGDRSDAELSLAYYLKVYFDNDPQLVYQVITEACDRQPRTDCGKKRKWLERDDEYRWGTIDRAYTPHVTYENFDEPLLHATGSELPIVSYVTVDKAMYVIDREGPITVPDIPDHPWFDRKYDQANRAVNVLLERGIIEEVPGDDRRKNFYSIIGSDNR